MVNKAAAECIVYRGVGRGMDETTPVEEDDDGDYLGGAEGGFEVDDAVLGGVFRGGAVDAVEEGGGPVDDVEGVDAIDRDRVGGDFSVEEFV